jgi:acyl transferase domain-containing protein/NAD(P)H-dependent flavin oxidoreductase YrpB (nitropropane dioxygenase family)/NAD(P)-dependent dehydrogenase (short-subunit alcohol dehydrogenase family)
MKNRLGIITPFETPDVSLALSVARAGAFPILHLGRDTAAAKEALADVVGRLDQPFGVCLADEATADIELPGQVSVVIAPWGLATPKVAKKAKVRMLWQVRSIEEAQEALAKKAKALVLKGAEGAGFCGEDSSFLLFQRLAGVCKKAGVDLYVQGGVGVHSAAAYLALGAAGVILDSQVALFPECGAPAEIKAAIERLSGSELRTSGGYRYLLRHGASEPDESATFTDILPRLGLTDDKDCLPCGQDAVLATELAGRYRRLRHLVKALQTAAFSQVRLAKDREFLCKGDAMSDYLGSTLPLAQGPMARISDVPAFLRTVADGGALPFLAMSMMTGDTAQKALTDTAEALGDKAWGVGILGFAYPKMLAEQARLIRETKPPFVLIAGGRPAQAKPFEQEGIKVFLHVPSSGLLDMFFKEGARSFVFEGRESGGHVGPLFSTVLWEKQMHHLLAQENLSPVQVLFAGGIHDELSAAFVRIMAAPLAARDCKIGLVAGTAYLFTDEAVSTGAITETYRRMLLEGSGTVLLHSSAGQETRAVPSPFTELFAEERKRMLDEGKESAEILMGLEELNIGRLRIASKGIERSGEELASLDEKQQAEKGLYMAGAITPLIREKTTMARLHKNLIEHSRKLVDALPDPQVPTPSPSPDAAPEAVAVAVIGMAGIFPDAGDLDEYWRNILFGKDSITEVPPERWSAELFYDPEGKDTDHVVSKWGGFLGTVDFDALEFGITPQSLSAIEPIQLLSLLVTKRAFEDAGYTDLTAADLEDTAVIFGAQGAGELTTSYGSRVGLRQLFGELNDEMKTMLPRLTEDSFPGMLSNVIAGRISNRLNTGGRNFTVDAACASSLAALDIAMAELSGRRAKMVVLGGADAHNSISDFLMFSSTYALSKRGYCATFDKEADGITLGEGVGVLILKRLEDARRDGDRIHAVIRGIGGSSDGKQLGLTAPSKRGQVRALEDAYLNAGIRPSEVGLIEAHGTGTVVGDRIELSALTDVYLDAGTVPSRTQLGSVKTQIGHTKCAAGAASLIKAILCVKHGLRPATLNLNEPNDAYGKDSPFFFRTEKTGLWSEDRRIAGISGFGFGGTNFHALLENATPERPETPLRAWPAELAVFRGETPKEAQAVMEKIVALCAVNNRLSLRDIACSLAAHNAEQPIQYSIVAEDTADLLTHIDAALAGREDAALYARSPVEGKVAFLFPGQGSQRVDMAADLFVLFPQMRRLLDAHPHYERILLPPTAFGLDEKRAQRAAITDTLNAQPLLGLVDLGIAKLLRDFGVAADMAAGHSYGELPALCFAGVIEEGDLASLSRRRAEAMLAALGTDPGGMIAVRTDRETLDSLLEGTGNVWAVNLNAPRQTVVAGTAAGLEALAGRLDEAKVAWDRLNVAGAFHSPLLAGAQDGFAGALADVRLHKTSLPVWSNTTAKPYPQAGAAVKKRLAEHLAKPVRFADEVEGMYAEGARVFIEAGPGGVLTGLASKTLVDGEAVFIQTERKDANGLCQLLHALARYVSTGRELDFEKVFKGRVAGVLEIEDPEQYRKRGTVWIVDGQRALPENGEPPAHAGKLITGEVLDLNVLNGGLSNRSPEQLVMAYLENMNIMIQDQHDVMAGYFGRGGAMSQGMEASRPFSFLTENANVSIAPAELATRESEEYAAEEEEWESPDILSLSSDEVMNIIFKVVSAKTGYPVDMLDFDADLEADLSIDSIKKMEIVAGLREYATFPENLEDMEDSFERLISIKTLRELLEWIGSLEESIKQNEAQAELFEGARAAIEITPSPEETTESVVVSRLILSESPAPELKADPSVIKDASFAITDDDTGLAVAVAEILEQRGAHATIITADATELTSYDGVVLINAAAAKTHYATIDLFNLLKRADMKKLHWVYSFDDALGTLLGKEGFDAADLGLLEGFTGFIKTLKHEYSDKRLCAVSFYTPIDPDTFPALVADELSDEDVFPEIFYRDAQRFRMMPKLEEQNETATATAPSLDENSCVLVLGGAQGITPFLVARLAEVYPCRYILVGRSEAQHEKEEYAELESMDEIRAWLIKNETGKQLGEIERKVRAIFKTNQIQRSLKLIEAAGAKASYRSADVRDTKAFRTLVEELREEYGAIDGVIHAAGILEDKLFNNKKADSFERVFDTKVDPLEVIIKDLLPELKLLVMFSSVTSTFGNAGQCDYAAGNTVMDSVALLLAHHRPELRVIAFNWGPWKGAGMVDEGLEQAFRRRGISFLHLEEGGEFFVNELIRGDKHNVAALAGSRQMLEQLLSGSLH